MDIDTSASPDLLTVKKKVMQRVIKFRGKTIEGGIWVYGNLHIEFDGTARICYWYSKLVDEENNCYEPTHACETVDPKTVGQYIGLNDKGGEAIYEGSICSGHSDGNGVIKWTDFDGGYNYEFEDTNVVGIYEVLKELRVIGNIHDNPDLLK